MIRKALFLSVVLLLPASVFGGTCITSHSIRAEIDPYRSMLRATDRFHVEGFETSEIRFLLSDNLEITELTLNGSPVRWSEKPDDPSFWEVNEGIEGEAWDGARVIEVYIPRGGDRSAEFYMEYEGVILDSLQESGAAYARSFATTTGLIEERGAFLSGSTVWIPTIPGDLFTFRLEVVVPGKWESVSQGKMEGRFDQGGRKVAIWSSEAPMEEIYLIAGPYVFHESPFGEVSIQTYLYEAEDADELMQLYTTAARQFIDRYSREYGPYPFAKFALVENFWQTGYGMPSFTLLGNRIIRLPHIPFTSFGHEILHNWWGNGVYVDWEKGNWCEGITAYGADYTYKADKGPAEAAAYRRGDLQKYRNYVSNSEDFPLVDFRGRHSAATAAVGYSKSTMFFHMLKMEVGSGPFREGLRRFFKERKFQVSSWDDLRRAFEEESGEDLSGFFTQWTTREGAPSLSLVDVKTGTGWGGKFKVEGKIRQDEPFFHVDVPVIIETEEGPESLVVYLEKSEKGFEWSGKARPLSVAVDPDFDVFRRLLKEEIPPALSQTMGGDSTLIILPPEDSPESLPELEALAESWAKGAGAEIVRGEVDEDLLCRRTVWLFGETVYTERFIGGLPEGSNAEGETIVLPAGGFERGSHSFVITTVHPSNPDLSWSLLLPENGEVIPALERKVPHYGKYGFLVFKGPQNVGKGEWIVRESPLRMKLEIQ